MIESIFMNLFKNSDLLPHNFIVTKCEILNHDFREEKREKNYFKNKLHLIHERIYVV